MHKRKRPSPRPSPIRWEKVHWFPHWSKSPTCECSEVITNSFAHSRISGTLAARCSARLNSISILENRHELRKFFSPSKSQPGNLRLPSVIFHLRSSLVAALPRCATLAVLFLSLTATFAQDKVPLKTELPKPLFVGTPVPVKLPNLEPPRKGKRADFMVPAGTTNLARGKSVTASDTEPVLGTLDLITDGDKDGEEGSYVELGPGKQWVQIDLEKEASIYAILLWHYHAQARVYLDVVAQISNDPAFKEGVTTVFNADADNELGLGAGKDLAYIETYEGKLIDARGVKGRYVRLYSKGNTSNKLNHYIEVEVFGKPAD